MSLLEANVNESAQGNSGNQAGNSTSIIVLKRNGVLEPLDLEKMHKVVFWASLQGSGIQKLQYSERVEYKIYRSFKQMKDSCKGVAYHSSKVWEKSQRRAGQVKYFSVRPPFMYPRN